MQNNEQVSSKQNPTIGILTWEYDFPSFRNIVGDYQNPETFDFPVRLLRVPGANLETIVKSPTQETLEKMIQAARQLEEEGVKAIGTSCGFNARIQRELADAVSVPVFASSLLLVPLVHRMLKEGQAVGILTADAPNLTEKHFRAVGIDSSVPIHVKGLEETYSFINIDSNPGVDVVSPEQLTKDVVEGAKVLVQEHPDVGAIVLECTALPPFAQAIRQAVGLPVFDVVNLANMMYRAVAQE